MEFIFKNLFIGEVVSTNGSLVFKALRTFPSNPNMVKIDLTALGLPADEYTIAVTSKVPTAGVESAKSKAVTYTAN